MASRSTTKAPVSEPTPQAIASGWRDRLDVVLATLQPAQARTVSEERTMIQRRRELEGAYASAALSLQLVSAAADRLTAARAALTGHDEVIADAEQRRDEHRAIATSAAASGDWGRADHAAREAEVYADLARQRRAERWAYVAVVTERAAEHEAAMHRAATTQADWLAVIEAAPATP